MVQNARRLVVALWAGSLWALGYLAAPTLFANLDSMRAGEMVGKLLERGAWLSIGCALAMLALLRFSPELDARRHRLLNIVTLAMLACTLAVYLGLQPVMAHLRALAGPAGVRGSPQWTQFAVLHGVSQLIYVIDSVLAGVLVVKNR